MRLNSAGTDTGQSYQLAAAAYPQSMERLNSLPPDRAQLQMSNSTSWSGPIVMVPNDLIRSVPDAEQNRQARRSWARSKRISLGCLEWRANPSVTKRAPRPNSANRRSEVQSIAEHMSDGDQSESGSTMFERVPSIATSTNTEQSKPGRFGRGKAYVGADALLRRLRMRPLSKSGRSKTPTPTSMDARGCIPTVPVRSLSTPRTGCMSKSSIDWQSNDACVFPNCSHGSRLNVATEESMFSANGLPQRTESFPAVGPCSNPAHCSCASNFHLPMSRSCMQNTGVFSMNLPYKPPSCSCMLGCNNNGTGGFVFTRNELYRPLSQPSCYFFGRGSSTGPSAAEADERNHSVPPMRYCTLPWSPTHNATAAPSEGSCHAIQYQSSSNVQTSHLPGHSIPDAAYLPAYCPHGSKQAYTLDAMESTAIPGPHYYTSRHGPMAFPNSKTTEALFVSCCDAQRPTLPPHVAAGSVPLNANSNDTGQLNNYVYSPRGRSMEQRRDVSLSWTGMDATLTTRQAKVTADQPQQTRPDSLLSASSLTTADSSQTDSLPNSSSSRDSALGGNTPQHMGCASFFNVPEFESDVRTHNHQHQHHHQQQPHHRYPQPHQFQQSAQDSRVWSSEEAHKNTKLAAQMEQSHKLHEPPAPKQTAVVEPRQPPTPTRSIVWPPRLAGLQDLGVSPPYRPSQKARADRKHSVYVNAAIYPLREQPQPQAGDRSGSRGGTPTTTGINGHCSPPASWTHLLPYRTSTVPQNLSERLKKSETLPNDVWVHARRPECSMDQHQNHQSLDSQTEQSVRYGGTNPALQTNTIPVGLKSPPPRPPVRTSSQQIVGREVSSESGGPPIPPLPVPVTQPTSQSTESNLLGMLTGDQALEDSPILCRYSQLYSLAIKPDTNARPKLKTTTNLSYDDPGQRGQNGITSSREIPTPAAILPPESQMQKLRIRADERD